MPRSVVLRDGRQCRLRKIQSDDAQALQAFVAGLSDRSAHQRFLASVHQLSDTQLRRFTQLEDERECAIVARELIDLGTQMGDARAAYSALDVPPPLQAQEGAIVGSARYLIEAAETHENFVEAEFAVTVADAWQGCGLGSLLMRLLLTAARAKGITRIEGHVLADNAQMLYLARKLGFSVQPEPGDAGLRQVVLRLR